MRSLAFAIRRLRTWLQTHEHLARRAVLVLGIAAGLSVVVQIVYPSGRTLPMVNAGGAPVGGQSVDDVTKQLQAYYDKATLTIQTEKGSTTKQLREIGVDIDYKATAERAAGYAWWERIIPFSSVGIMLGRNTLPVTDFDKQRVEYFAEQTQAERFVPSKDAGAGIKKGKVVLVPAQPSYAYPAAAIRKAVYAGGFSNKTVIRMESVIKPAARSDEQVKKVLPAVQKIVDRAVVLTLPAQKKTLSKETTITWVSFTPKATKQLAVGINQQAVAIYVADLKAATDKAPGTTIISIVDGAEAGRRGDGDGLGVDAAATTAAIVGALEGTASGNITVPVAVTPATIVYERTYSKTSKGLGVLLGDVATAKGGYGMAVIELGGGNRANSANGDKQFTSASTFKLFVAYGVFQRMASGSMHWSDIIYGGKNAEKCFDDMIVVSDNNCAIAFGNIVGWGNVQTMMKNLGLTHTQVVAGNHLTTANDLALLLQKLQDGSLVSSGDRDRLINAMKRNIYRAGIPAGTGVTVANKVGFIDGYLNDAAIVYGPKATYIMVILSKGSTWAQIADATKQVYAYLNS